MKRFEFKAWYQMPYFERQTELPWKVEAGDCCLSRDMSHENVGMFLLALLQYGNHEGAVFSGSTKDELVARILRHDSLVIAGGVTIENGNPDEAIYPGCCCGLETWRDWFHFLKEGHSPWLGHDPSPRLEKADDRKIMIWQDEGLDSRKRVDQPDLVMDEVDFTAGLKRVERDFLGFLVALEDWVLREEIAEPDRLVEKMDQAFDIRPDYVKADWWKKYN